MEHDIPFGNSNRENGSTFLDFPLFLGIFQWDEPTKRVPFTAEPEIPEILTKWKAPKLRPPLGKIQRSDLALKQQHNRVAKGFSVTRDGTQIVSVMCDWVQVSRGRCDWA